MFSPENVLAEMIEYAVSLKDSIDVSRIYPRVAWN